MGPKDARRQLTFLILLFVVIPLVIALIFLWQRGCE